MGLFKGWKIWAKEEEPIPGETWGFRDESPWPETNAYLEVLDVKEGWVRFTYGGPRSDERMKMQTFKQIFRYVDEAEKYKGDNDED